MLTDVKNNILIGLGGSSICMGIFRSTDEGKSWTALNAGLTDSSISVLALSPNGYVFTVAGQLFRSVSSTRDNVQGSHTDSSLNYHISPNPTTSSTTIFLTPEA